MIARGFTPPDDTAVNRRCPAASPDVIIPFPAGKDNRERRIAAGNTVSRGGNTGKRIRKRLPPRSFLSTFALEFLTESGIIRYKGFGALPPVHPQKETPGTV